MKEQFVMPLLAWFEHNKRQLPWRLNRNPYEIWISEIMLQQTRVEAVIGYYERFLKELPNVAALAECEEDKLMKLWEGLGYYSRARNLKKGAIKIMQDFDGVIPNTKKELLTIPGIGSYTASAIASQAFEEPVAAVDGNVLRVYSRYLEDARDIMKAKTKSEIESELAPIMPNGKSGDFNQAMMELGATICIPNGAPKCEQCPIADTCLAKKNQSYQAYPKKTPKKQRRIEQKTVLLLYREDKVLLRKRKDEGLLAGLYEFPNIEGHQSKKTVLEHVKAMGFEPLQIKKVPEAVHIFSHVEWHMIGYEIRMDETASYPMDYMFIETEQLKDTYSVPSAFAAYKKHFLKKK